MKAMILAAGKGTRVRPLTYELPKPMIPILGKPVMAYLVEHLQRHGVSEIMVNVSYLHEKRRLEAFINISTFTPSRLEYNDYLGWLAAHPGARPGDYPGRRASTS